MPRTYLRLDKAPSLHHPGGPICGACLVETNLEDGWVCPSCGTSWPSDVVEDDGENAELYESWSGEELTGPTCPTDEAWRVSHLEDADRDAAVEKLLGQATGESV